MFLLGLSKNNIFVIALTYIYENLCLEASLLRSMEGGSIKCTVVGFMHRLEAAFRGMFDWYFRSYSLINIASQ